MGRMSKETPKFSVFERVLAYAASAIIIVAVLSYLTTLIVGLSAGHEALVDGLWPFVTWVAFYGLPIGFVLLMVLLGVNFTRRGRGSKG